MKLIFTLILLALCGCQSQKIVPSREVSDLVDSVTKARRVYCHYRKKHLVSVAENDRVTAVYRAWTAVHMDTERATANEVIDMKTTVEAARKCLAKTPRRVSINHGFYLISVDFVTLVSQITGKDLKL